MKTNKPQTPARTSVYTDPKALNDFYARLANVSAKLGRRGRSRLSMRAVVTDIMNAFTNVPEDVLVSLYRKLDQEGKGVEQFFQKCILDYPKSLRTRNKAPKKVLKE